jgi:hypothetical protein
VELILHWMHYCVCSKNLFSYEQRWKKLKNIEDWIQIDLIPNDQTQKIKIPSKGNSQKWIFDIFAIYIFHSGCIATAKRVDCGWYNMYLNDYPWFIIIKLLPHFAELSSPHFSMFSAIWLHHIVLSPPTYLMDLQLISSHK